MPSMMHQFLPSFENLQVATAFLAHLSEVHLNMTAPVTLRGTFELTVSSARQCEEEGDWAYPILGQGPLAGELGEIRLLEWQRQVGRRIKELSRPGDPYPHASYLAVASHGEVIGQAEGHPGNGLPLTFSPEPRTLPAQFFLRPTMSRKAARPRPWSAARLTATRPSHGNSAAGSTASPATSEPSTAGFWATRWISMPSTKPGAGHASRKWPLGLKTGMRPRRSKAHFAETTHALSY